MRLAVQLYTLRDLLERDVPGTLNQVRNAGFQAVETAGTYGMDVRTFRYELDQAGLQAVAAHVALDDVEDRTQETVSMAKTLGAEWLVVPWIPKEAFQDGWAAFGRRLGTIAESLLSVGMKFAYHNHAFEFEPEDGVPGYETLWNSAPVTVEAELDLYWAHNAGQDPVDWLRNLSGRVPLAHFKDGVDGQFTPVGQGQLDWAGLLPVAKNVGVEWAIVELDECPKDPLECVSQSFDYLHKLGVDA